MAQYRQLGARDYDLHHLNGAPDHVSVGIRPNAQQQQQQKTSRHRRFVRSDKTRRVSIGSIGVILSLGLFITLLAYYYLSRDNRDTNVYQDQDDDLRSDLDFLTNVTRTEATKVLGFGKGSVAHGRDSRYWDRDDRRRDEDYNEDMVQQTKGIIDDKSNGKNRVSSKVRNDKKMSSGNISQKRVGLYNEAGRNELKIYEAEYEASLKNSGLLGKENNNKDQLSDDDGSGGQQHETVDADDDYDGVDSHDVMDERGDYLDHSMANSNNKDNKAESDKNFETGSKARVVAEVAEKLSKGAKVGEFSDLQSSNDLKANSRQATGQAAKKSRSDSKRKKRRSCEMKLLNSTAQLVEPLESRKFSRFSLQYVEREEKPDGQAEWEPRFAGHQDLLEREESFLAHDKRMKCGFIKGPVGTPSTGFDLTEDDENYISRCHIAVVSCIFGNSDRLRAPATKTISKLSRKYVCFVMFVDEYTLQTLNSEGHMMDTMGFIGFWKIVVVKNLPYIDMRRVGKIPKLLSHRLFPSARYSIWMDSKLRLQMDPLLILEYFLWRKGHEYAISNHYDRHCVWEEVAQNKKLNKYNHSVIDEQFRFYQADGLKRFNHLDPMKLLPSNVPEGSFIVRAHTPMSNLFSCLWFNEVDRFTPRDQLSFAYTYQKLRRMNPGKPFHLNMFRDCERRKIAKLFHHRLEERRRNTQQQEAE